jgi:hypothetical protein
MVLRVAITGCSSTVRVANSSTRPFIIHKSDDLHCDKRACTYFGHCPPSRVITAHVLKPVPAEDGEEDLNFVGIFEGVNRYRRTQNNQSNQKAN